MRCTSCLVSTVAVAIVFLGPRAWGASRQNLAGHVPQVVNALRLKSVDRLAPDVSLDLHLGLPLRNQAQLSEELRQIYTSGSTNFHQYLTPAQFLERFGPTEQDYQQVVAFAESNRLKVILTHANRNSLHVRGAVRDIERTFHVTLRTYQHPTEARPFYAPDTEPSVDLTVPLAHVSGLDNFIIPHSPDPRLADAPPAGGMAGGSGYAGYYSASDLRAAYAPDVPTTGTGQVVGVLDFNTGYYPQDIARYEASNSLPNIPIQNVFLDGYSGAPTIDNANTEISMDMEMVMAMAPGIAQLTVYGAPNYTYAIDVLNEIASPSRGEPLPRQLTTSFELFYNNTSIYQALQQMARQGQTFFCGAGDHGAYVSGNGPFVPCDYPYVTAVGGTVLTTSGPGGRWASETVWNDGGGWATGGGPSPWYVGQNPPDTNFAIPDYQVGMDVSLCGGSTVGRNCPDVAMVARDVLICYHDGAVGGGGGTSASSPLWAGYCALINQQAAGLGLPSVGFLNPMLYSIGRSDGGLYSACFHDVTTGNNSTHNDPTHYQAVQGYDLCTGWGSPAGANLIVNLSIDAGAVWVDFSYSGTTQNGTYQAPYKTIAQGIAAVASHGTIAIKSSIGNEHPMITKPLTIISVNGSSRIGW